MLRNLNRKLLYNEPVPFWEWSMRHNNIYNMPEVFLDLPFFIRNKLATKNVSNNLIASKFLLNFKLPRRKRNILFFLYSYLYTLFKRLFYYRRVLRLLLNFVHTWVKSFLNKELFIFEKLLEYIRTNKYNTNTLFILLRNKVKPVFETYKEVIGILVRSIKNIYRKKMFRLRYISLYYVGIHGLTSAKQRRVIRLIRTLFDIKSRALRSPSIFFRKIFNLYIATAKNNVRHYINKKIKQPVVSSAQQNNTFYLYLLDTYLASKYNSSLAAFMFFIKKNISTHLDWDLVFQHFELSMKRFNVLNIEKLCVAIFLILRNQRNTASVQLKYITSLFFSVIESIISGYARRARVRRFMTHTKNVYKSSQLQLQWILNTTRDSSIHNVVIKPILYLQRKILNSLSIRYLYLNTLLNLRLASENTNRNLNSNKNIIFIIKWWRNRFKLLRKVARLKKKRIQRFFSKKEKLIRHILYPPFIDKFKKKNKKIKIYINFFRTRGSQEVVRYSYAYADYYKDNQYEWLQTNRLYLNTDTLKNKYVLSDRRTNVKIPINLHVWRYLYLYKHIEEQFAILPEYVFYKKKSVLIPRTGNSYSFIKMLLSAGCTNLIKSPFTFITETGLNHKQSFVSRILKKNEKLRYNKI